MLLGTFCGLKLSRARIDETTIVENGEAHPFDHGDRVLDRPPDQGISADWIALGILWTHVTEPEPAQSIGATGIETIKDRDDGVIRCAPVHDGPDFAVQKENRVVGKVEVLGRVQVITVNLNASSEEAAGRIGCQIDPRSFPGQKRAVAGIISQAEGHPALKVALTSYPDDVEQFRRNAAG